MITLMKMTFEEFIKNHVTVAPEGKHKECKHIKFTSAQYAFLDWIEKCKQKGLRPFYL